MHIVNINSYSILFISLVCSKLSLRDRKSAIDLVVTLLPEFPHLGDTLKMYNFF